MKIITCAATGFKLKIDGLSRNAIVQELASAGQTLGKTSVSELLAGTKQEVKGFIIQDVETKRRGRKPIFGKAMSQKEISARYYAKHKKEKGITDILGRKLGNQSVELLPDAPIGFLRDGTIAKQFASLVVSGVVDYANITTKMQEIRPDWNRQQTSTYATYLEKHRIVKRIGVSQRKG